MRLALISSLLPADNPGGGAEAYVEASARWLAASHDVTVLAGSEAKLDGIPTVRLPGLPQLDRTSSLPVKLAWHGLDQWLPTVHVAAVRELRRIRPDVVVTHELQGLSAGVFTAIRRLGLPHVYTAHDLNLLCVRTSMTRRGEYCGGRCLDCRVQRRVRGGAARARLDRLIGVSRYIVRRHVEAGIVDDEHAHVIRLGAAPGNARLRHAAGDAVTLGFIGALARHKGVPTLLDAFDHAPPGWRLLLAGSGDLTSVAAEAAARDPRIEHLGRVEGEAKERFFDEVDLVVVPSEWEEPATFVAVEAAVRGIPAVVSDRGGLPETPESVLFHAGDPEDLLRAVRWFLDHDNLARSSERLLARREEFEWSTHVRRVDAVLEEVHAESRRS
jgi:glycosyltransferase involved in cell wall biosynthesis